MLGSWQDVIRRDLARAWRAPGARLARAWSKPGARLARACCAPGARLAPGANVPAQMSHRCLTNVLTNVPNMLHNVPHMPPMPRIIIKSMRSASIKGSSPGTVPGAYIYIYNIYI